LYPQPLRGVIKVSVSGVSERRWGLGRVGGEKPDLDEEIDFALAQFDYRAATSAPSAIEAPIRAFR
jgi:hypothetical protein